PFTLAVSPVVLIFVIAIKFLAIFIQTYIFMILSVVYIAGAVAHEEH
ncbi:MAG: F0F1 ATP synthase subunit A, partial [Aquifex sp.]